MWVRAETEAAHAGGKESHNGYGKAFAVCIWFSIFLLDLSEKLLTQKICPSAVPYTPAGFEVPPSLVLEAQIAEATHKGDAQEASSAVLQAYSKVQSLA